MTVFICIPVYNRIPYTLECIKSIECQIYSNIEIVICDDGSTDKTSEIINMNYPNIKIIRGDGNLWWSGSMNCAIRYVLKNSNNDDYIYTLNNDTILESDCISELINFITNKNRYIVSSLNLMLRNPSKIENSAFIQHKTGLLKNSFYPIFKTGTYSDKLKNEFYEVDTFTGKGVLIPIGVFKEIGLFHNELRQYHADTEFFFRAKKSGYHLYLLKRSKLLSHTELTGIGTKYTKTSLLGFIQSFFSIRSAHYIPALKKRAQLIYKYKWPYFFVLNILGIILGRLKRLYKNISLHD